MLIWAAEGISALNVALFFHPSRPWLLWMIACTPCVSISCVWVERPRKCCWTGSANVSVPTEVSLKMRGTWVVWGIVGCRAANQYGTSVFCTDFTCKIREYEFGLQNTEIVLCQFCHIKYCCQNKAYLVLGSKSVKICGILCLKTFKCLFNHQNIHSSLFHMW